MLLFHSSRDINCYPVVKSNNNITLSLHGGNGGGGRPWKIVGDHVERGWKQCDVGGRI